MCIILQSQALRCASHWGVHFASHQTEHREVKIQIFVILWLLLKGQSGEILLGVNTSIMKGKIWRTFVWFAKPKILTPRCHAHGGGKFFGEIETEFENTLACFLGAQIGLNLEKNGGRKSRDTLPPKLQRIPYWCVGEEK